MKTLLLFAVLVLSINVFGQVPSYVPTDSLIGYWPFNGNANDESGNGNNGTVTGATLTTDRFGNTNKAYSFNGTNNYIDCGPLSAIPNTVGDITQSAWILAPNDQTAYCKMAIMSKRQLLNQGWPTIGGGANGVTSFPVNNQAYFFLNAQNYSAGVSNAMSSTGLTNDGNWHLVTGTKNGSTYKLYFNGTLQASLTDNYSLTSNSNLIIGHEAMWGFECEKWFAGKLDDIGIWNRALTQCEISALYNAQSIINGTDTQSACDSYTWVDGNTYTSSNNSATYTASNAAGCDSLVTLDLTITPLPDNNVTQAGSLLTADQAGATYQWLDCDNNNQEINGEINQFYTPAVTGNYAIEVTLNGCVDTSACFLVDYTGIEELLQNKKELVKIVDFMGREAEFKPNTPLIFIYSDGTRERVMKIEE